eukprot:symbB.v1.2.010838.t1/scaffold683.1/size173061/11
MLASTCRSTLQPLRCLFRSMSAEAESGNVARLEQVKRSQKHQRSYRSVCPFTVHRTASDNLPVYVIKRLNRTQDVTVVKKLRGDPDAFKREIEFLCQARARYGKSGFLQIVGNHKRVIKGYLRSIGY